MQTFVAALSVFVGALVGGLFVGWRILKRFEVPLTPGEARELKRIAMQSWRRQLQR